MPDSNDPCRLDGKVALVTGATGGIGEATAALFLQLGAKVVLVGRNHDKLRDCHKRLEGEGECATARADCTDEAAMNAAVQVAVDRFGGLDIVIANAGTEGALKPIEELDVAEFEEVLKVNVIGVWLAMKAAAGPLKARGKGAIVAISSIAGTIGFPGMAPYISSKHAVVGLVKTVALELAPHKIRVNAVGPGPIDNRMMASLGDQLGGGDPKGFRTFVEERIPLGRYGTNVEMARMIAFLSSDAASYCTGGLYLADGGYVAA